MPRTVLRSATKRPVRYSARWRRWHSLAKRPPSSVRPSRTILGNSTIPGMIVCSAVQQRQGRSGSNRATLAYLRAVAGRITKPQLISKNLGQALLDELGEDQGLV